MASYSDLLSAVENYYGSGSDEWYRLSEFGIDSPESVQILQSLPGVEVTTANDGTVLGWDFANAFPDSISPAAEINSNVQSGTYGSGAFNANVNGTAVTNPQTGVTTLSSGAKGALGTIATVADKIGLAYAGVSLGTKLGKAIDSALYNISPTWWDEHFPYINPETWDSMATTEGGQQFVRGLFGLQNDSSTLYLDERLLAQTYMMLLESGAYSSGESTATVDPDSSWLNGYPNSLVCGSSLLGTVMRTNGQTVYYECQSPSPYTVLLNNVVAHPRIIGYSFARDTYPAYKYRTASGYIPDTWRDAYNFNTGTTLVSGTPYYVSSGAGANFSDSIPETLSSTVNTIAVATYNLRIIATILIDGTIVTPGTLDGVNDDARASTYIDPSLITGTTLDEVLQQLKQYYPQLFDGAVDEIVVQPDGTTKTVTYIPVPQPVTDANGQPITGTTSQIDIAVTPENTTETQLQQLTDSITETVTPPDTGTGNTPVIPIPVGSANALFSIYNPSQAQLNNFGAWLWSSNFVDQLLKVFNDPMQSIIGLHKVFATPPTSGSSTIHVGYLDSGVGSAVVGGQYTSVDCGTVAIDEYYGNVFDYSPFTQISLYLPFIGIVPIDSGDVMRSKMNIKYHVDVITGACLAEVRVKRDGENAILYTYSGNCAVQYPTSSGSYMGIVGALAATVGTVASAIATGGATAPMAIGAATSLMGAHTQVSKSGAFSGNSGAMGIKKPYIIISRIQPNIASTAAELAGKPANKSTQIKECNGFIKCREFILSGIPATESELNEIAGLLTSGVYV